MTNKIPKKLMREFGRITGLQEIMRTGVMTKNARGYDLNNLQDVIDLAAGWCIARKWYFSMVKLRHSKGWVVMVNTQQEEGYLPRAIMTAIVAAAKETKEAGW